MKGACLDKRSEGHLFLTLETNFVRDSVFNGRVGKGISMTKGNNGLIRALSEVCAGRRDWRWKKNVTLIGPFRVGTFVMF